MENKTTTSNTETLTTTPVYSVRRPGCTSWASQILGEAAAESERETADRVCAPGHMAVLDGYVLRLAPRKWVTIERMGQAWGVRGGGPAGRSGSWRDASVERLARTVEREDRLHGHILTHRTRTGAVALL